MKFYGKSEKVCDKILETFETGDLPNALAPIFVNRKDNIPSNNWSFMNQMIMIINRTGDARTFKQWNSVGRKVIGKAFYILAPVLKSIPKEVEKDGKKETEYIKILVGFKSIPEFRIEDTEIYDEELWEKHCGVDKEEKERLENLPLREVAEKWGLDITSYNGKGSGALGYYQPGKRIAVGVKNLSVWTHELVHAADDKLGNLKKIGGQEKTNEIVAEFGAQVLLKILGFEKDVDLTGAWKYIQHYTKDDKKKTIKEISSLINRICAAVNLIFEESDVVLNDK